MLRVADLLADGADGAPEPELREALPKPVPIAADEQVALRALAEQLVSEANAVLHDQLEHVELDDELVAGQLGFRVSFGSRSALVTTRFGRNTAVGELVGTGAVPSTHVELAGPGQLEELILLLLAAELEPAIGQPHVNS
jgi:hypothetical protein